MSHCMSTRRHARLITSPPRGWCGARPRRQPPAGSPVRRRVRPPATTFAEPAASTSAEARPPHPRVSAGRGQARPCCEGVHVFLRDRLGHLSYSTLVHPGDDWDPDEREPRPLRARDQAPGLPEPAVRRLSAALRSVSHQAGRLPRRARAGSAGFLDEQDLYVYTVNAFPHGSFKGGPVMERVYEPDWTSENGSSTRRTSPTCSRSSPHPVPSRPSRPCRWRIDPRSPASPT